MNSRHHCPIKGFNDPQPLAVLSRSDRPEEVAIITPAAAKMLPLFPGTSLTRRLPLTFSD